MIEQPLAAVAVIVVLGIAAQWIAWRLNVPSILLLLGCGFILGPGAQVLDPDALFGTLLFPFVSVSVALILFEGGLTLNLRELAHTGKVVRNLVSIGALITWAVAIVAADWFLPIDRGLAVVLGAILVVSGPTVVGPLLRQVRPSGASGSILKWEGILIDPIGAMLAVLSFEALREEEFSDATATVVAGVLKTAGAGFVVGLVGAGLLVLLLRRYLVPDFLHVAVSLALVVGAFTLANELHEEAGLLAVTVMGIALATQRVIPVKHILEFKENLRVLLLSGLFIVLAARLTRNDIRMLGLETIGFIALMIFVARPLAVVFSTIRSKLTWKERAFIAWVAPRGIVAAAVASVFAIKLADEGRAQGDLLVPATFAVIVATIAVYGSTASWVARRLGIAEAKPQGVLIVGAHPWGREIARSLHSAGIRVVLSDTNWTSISAARMDGLPTYYGSVLSDFAMDQLDLGGIGRMIAITPNDEVNTLAVQRFAHVFGRKNVYQLTPKGGDGNSRHAMAQHLRGRSLFGSEVTFGALDERFHNGALKSTNLTGEFDFEAFKARYADAIPLFLLTDTGKATIMAADDRPTPKAGQRLIALTGATRD